jgi:hypothetical protein
MTDSIKTHPSLHPHAPPHIQPQFSHTACRYRQPQNFARLHLVSSIVFTINNGVLISANKISIAPELQVYQPLAISWLRAVSYS